MRAWKEQHPTWFVVLWTNALAASHFPRELRELRALTRMHAAPKAAPRRGTSAAGHGALRYHILARFGGVYIDADLVPVRPIERLATGPFAVCASKEAWGGGLADCTSVSSAVIGCRRGCARMQKVADLARRLTKERLELDDAGPGAVVSSGAEASDYNRLARLWSTEALAIGLGAKFRVLAPRSFFACNSETHEAWLCTHFTQQVLGALVIYYYT